MISIEAPKPHQITQSILVCNQYKHDKDQSTQYSMIKIRLIPLGGYSVVIRWLLDNTRCYKVSLGEKNNSVARCYKVSLRKTIVSQGVI